MIQSSHRRDGTSTSRLLNVHTRSSESSLQHNDTQDATKDTIDMKFITHEQESDEDEYVGNLLCTMLKSSEFVYTYASIRNVVLKHGMTLTQNTETNKIIQSPPESRVEFYTPDLVRKLFEINREGDNTNRLLKFPVEASNFLKFLERNRKYFNQGEKGGLVSFNTNHANATSKEEEGTARQLYVEKLIQIFASYKGVLFDYDDQFTNSGGLVYGITCNRAYKRITVVFRGTVGGPDVKTCANFLHNSKVFSFAGKGIKIHAGFATYLFNTIPGKGRTKYDRIVACLKEIYEDIPDDEKDGYQLYVTGHSLGGALSNIFSFAAASKEEEHPLFKEIKTITFAAPVVGNVKYNHAFQKLERSGKLKYLRISNQGDVIPTSHVPGYTQNGVNMHLFGKDKIMELKYRNTKSIGSQISKDPLGDHGFPTYYERLFQRSISEPLPENPYSLNIPNVEILRMSFDEVYKTGGDFTN